MENTILVKFQSYDSLSKILAKLGLLFTVFLMSINAVMAQNNSKKLNKVLNFTPPENGYVVKNVNVKYGISISEQGTRWAHLRWSVHAVSEDVVGYKYNGTVYNNSSEIYNPVSTGDLEDAGRYIKASWQIMYKGNVLKKVDNAIISSEVNNFGSVEEIDPNSNISDYSITNLRISSTNNPQLNRAIENRIQKLKKEASGAKGADNKSDDEVAKENTTELVTQENTKSDGFSYSSNNESSISNSDTANPKQKSNSASANNNVSEVSERNRQAQIGLLENYEQSVRKTQASMNNFNSLVNSYTENQRKRAESKQRFKEKMREDARMNRQIEAENRASFLRIHKDMKETKKDYINLVSELVSRNDQVHYLSDFFKNSEHIEGEQVYLITIDIYKAIPDVANYGTYSQLIRDWERFGDFVIDVTLSDKPLQAYVNKTMSEKYPILQYNESKEIQSIVLISKSKDELGRTLGMLKSTGSGTYLKINSEDGNISLRDRMGDFEHIMLSNENIDANSYYKKGIYYYGLAGNQANKKFKDENLKTAIHYLRMAAEDGHEKASRIVKKFPDFDQIMNAFKEADLEAVKFLFEEGVLSKERSSNFHLKRISKAQSHRDRDYVYYDRMDPLLASIFSEDSLLIRYVLDQGYNINKTYSDFDKGTALHVAIKNGILKSTLYLLQNGAETSIENHQGHTPLSIAVSYMASSNNNSDPYNIASLWLINTLIAYGASPNERLEKAGYYILHYAAEQPLPDATKKLLEIGADPNVVDDKDKRTPLYYAVWKGNYKMVKVLLQYGASLDLKDNYGISPYKYAKQRKEKEIVSLMKEYR